nr:hypothetical protein [Tanacetum cinerariifolium]
EWGDQNKEYAKLSAVEKIQADCDMKATNIILQGLPTDIYSLMNHHRVAKDLWERVQLLMQDSIIPLGQKNNLAEYMILSGADNHPPMLDKDLVAKDLWERVQLLMQGDDPIACLNKAMAFLTAVVSSKFPSTNNQLRTSSNPRNQATIQDGRVTMQQAEDLDTYDSNCDDISNAKAVLMANISNYSSNVISEAQQDSMILYVIEQMSKQMINHVNDWEKANKEHNNESVTAELERYKE